MLDDLPLAVAAGVEDLLHKGAEGLPAGDFRQKPPEGGLADEAVFDHLPHPVEEDPVGEGVEGVGVDQHQFRLVKEAGEVFPLFEVDRHLAADRRVHLGEQGGRHLDIRHPPQHRPGGKPRHIPSDAAAEGDNQVGAGEGEGAGGQKLVVDQLQPR